MMLSRPSPSPSPAAAAASAALTAMLAFNACPSQAFMPASLVPAPRAMHHAAFSSSPAVPTTTTTTMRYDNYSPWNLGCGGNTESFGSSSDNDNNSNSGRGRGLQRRRNRFNPMIFEPSGAGLAFQDSHQLQVGDAEVTDTGDTYKLTFEVSALVDRDGLDVSISGRLLTVKVRRGFGAAGPGTDPDPDTDAHSYRSSSSGWVTRRNRTTGFDSTISRSFELPEGVSASGGTASLTPEGNVEVVFTKDAATTTPVAEPPHGELSAEPVWGDDDEETLWFPSEGEMAGMVEAAREARAKRVELVAIRRATMATEVSEKEDDGSYYLVRIALPEGATRNDVKLAVTPENSLSVSFAAEGRRPLSKDVRLPNDAVLLDVAAKFEAEQEEGRGGESGGISDVAEPAAAAAAAAAREAVSGLVVTVGRAVPLRANLIDIIV